MRPLSYILAVLLLAPAGTARAAGVVEARAEVQRALDGARELRSRQAQLRGELGEAAGRIHELKAREQGILIPGGELSRLLRRSQELSSSLTEVEAALARAESELQQRSGALVDALDGELESARDAFDRAGREERRALLERMRALRRERDQVRAQLPEARLPRVGGEDSDDPTDLLEQADALRDTQDKVKARLKALDRRIAELEREQELDRRMGEFLGEGQAFDERDRRLGVSGPSAADDKVGLPTVELQVSGPLFVPTHGARDPSPQVAGASHGGPLPEQRQPQGGAAWFEGSDEEMAAMVKQRHELEAMSREVGARANELERRARDLR